METKRNSARIVKSKPQYVVVTASSAPQGWCILLHQCRLWGGSGSILAGFGLKPTKLSSQLVIYDLRSTIDAHLKTFRSSQRKEALNFFGRRVLLALFKQEKFELIGEGSRQNSEKVQSLEIIKVRLPFPRFALRVPR